jgi:8-oxo-dGTP pyrophosphatase MutT (NUDIX family)
VSDPDTLRAAALATLRAWPAPDGAQERLRTAYVDHLESHPDGVRRSCFPDHLTAGTIVLSPDGGSVLLNLHRKARRWIAFGGHTEDGDATLADTAQREAREESGMADLVLDPIPVHLDLHTVSFCDPRGEVRHLDVRYGAVAPQHATHDVSDESLDVRWWALDALPDLEDEMHTLIRLARGRLF